MRDLRGFALWSAFWAGWTLLVPAVMMSPQRIAVIWAGGGIAAGALILVERSRWWTVLVPLAAAVGTVWYVTGSPVGHVVIRTITDVSAVVLYAVIVRRHRRARSGLGADAPWVFTAAALSALVRVGAVFLLAFVTDSPVEERLWNATIEIGMSTVVGLVAGSATVLGVAGWRRGLVPPRERGRAVALGLGIVAVLAVAYFTGVGTAVPALEFLVFPLLLVAALLLPVPLTAALTGASLIAISLSIGNGLGAFAPIAPADPSEILTAQTYMLTIAVSVFLLAATAADRRSALVYAESAAALMSATFRQSPTPAALVWMQGDQPAAVKEANPAFERLVGAAPGEVNGVPLLHVMVAADVDDTLVLSSGVDVRVLLADGSVRWLRPALSDRLLDDDDERDERDERTARLGEFAVLVLEDVTAERTSEELLRQQARRDQLTGLPNRLALIERLDEALESVGGSASVGLLLVDIDGLQTFNDSLGHAAGDQIVIEVGRRLAAQCGAQDVVVRLGGDEFGVVTTGAAEERRAEAAAEMLRDAVAENVAVAGRDVAVSLTGGLATITSQDVRTSDLIRRADIALMRAKARGRGHVVEFQEGDERPLEERIDIEARLRRALAERSLVCLFQPTAAIGTGVIVGTEVLVRLAAEDGSLLPPGAFLPLAADLGLMGELTVQVLDRACEAAAQWHASGTDVRVAFNAPPAWLSAETALLIAESVQRRDVPPHLITVEVTEEGTLSAGPAALAALEQLRELGMHVAIDDFGTGYAGLDAFRSVPADIVKIDMTFVSDMMRTPEDRELVRSMIDLIHRFGKVSVAEGVETPAQFQALGEMGCDVVQGYLVGRPMPFDEVPAGRRLTRPDPGGGNAAPAA